MNKYKKTEIIVEGEFYESNLQKQKMNKYLKSSLTILYFFVYSVMIYVPFVILDIEISNVPDALFNIYYISVQTILFASLFAIYKDDFNQYFKDFKEHGEAHFKLGFKYWVIGLSVMIASNIIIGALSPIAIPENEQAVRAALELSPLFIIFSAVIDAPIVEEILFRKTLFDIFKNKRLFVIISGLLFGVFHILGVGTSLYSWLYVIPYAALGMTFAYSYVKTNNLLTPICLHAFHNLITIIQILLFL
jgi:membrane protease YdiL (CAAX protease family)